MKYLPWNQLLADSPFEAALDAVHAVVDDAKRESGIDQFLAEQGE